MLNDFVILCGGQGTRLRSVVGESQKVMAAIGNEPFLDLLIKYIRAQGGKRVILSTGYKAQDVESHFAGRFKDMTIEFSREDEPLGTGGAIKKACGLVKSDDFFVLNGDSFCPVDFNACLKFHKDCKAQATIAVAPTEKKDDYGSITLDGQKRIVGFEEKSSSSKASYVNAGVYCFKRGIESLMPAQSKFSLEKDFFTIMIGQYFYGFTVDEPFLDIGTPERLRSAQERLKSMGL